MALPYQLELDLYQVVNVPTGLYGKHGTNKHTALRR